MLDKDYHYLKMDAAQRQAGLRRAQLNGTAYEHRPKRIWPWMKRDRLPASERPVAGGISRPATGARS